MAEEKERKVSGEKDRAEKYLLSKPDVFADITNVLIAEEEIVTVEDLIDGPTQSVYKAEPPDGLREQSRDVSKYVEQAGIRIALIGIENQSTVDQDMVFRVMGYDYASYRSQIDAGKERYPVITGVLYFGDRPWTGPHTIGEAVQLPEKYREFFADYKIHVIDIPRLPESVRKNLKSDFAMVADLFANRHREDYVPGSQVLQHPQEVLEFLRVFTGDERYRRIEMELISRVERGEKITMCDFLERAEQKGIQKGIQEGIQEGIQKGIQEGETRTLKLMEKLAECGRLDELKHVTEDTEYRENLYKEFGI